jgi:hypothetical protein
LALSILVTGLALGVAGDALLRVGPWGANGLIWTALLVAAMVLLAGWHRRRLGRGSFALLPLALAFAAGLVWRDAESLKLLNLGGVGLALVWAAKQARGVRWPLGGVFDYAWQLGRSGFDAAAGYVPLFLVGTLWPQAQPDGWRGRARALAVGVALALLPLILFGALLVSADAVFRQLVNRFVDLDFSTWLSHLFPIAVCSWITGGYLVGLLFRETSDASPTLPQFLALGTLEVQVAVALVDLLFLSFIAVQARYLFGGANLVAITPGLTYAEYARQGFFQLVAVVVFALPLLLGADWLLGKANRRWFRVLAAATIAMLLVILISAGHRLRLYEREYGWTELRWYVAAFMGWLAAVLVWFAATVLAGRRERFMSGALVAGLLGIALVNVWNPHAWIAQRNHAHARTGHKLDAAYLAELSGDAVPTLVRALPDLSEADRQIILNRLRRWAKADARDWRVWSWSRAAARAALAGVPEAASPAVRSNRVPAPAE